VILYPISARSLIDSNEVFKLEKIYARSECPDGNASEPVCVENIVWPLATITPMREAGVHICKSVILQLSFTAIYVPVDPESAFNLLETENSSPRSALKTLFI
jgi:hypothetical protein